MLDLSVVAPVFFTGPELAKNAQVWEPSASSLLGNLGTFSN